MLFHYQQTELDLVSAIRFLGWAFIIGCAILGGSAVYCCMMLTQKDRPDTASPPSAPPP